MIATIFIGSSNKHKDRVDFNSANAVEQTNQTSSEIVTEENILYWGTTCPYCHDVTNWIKENDTTGQLKIALKEVYENQQNSAELTARAKGCGIDERAIGVPFMYTVEGSCLIGMPNITEYLSTQLDQVKTVENSSSFTEIDKTEKSK